MWLCTIMAKALIKITLGFVLLSPAHLHHGSSNGVALQAKWTNCYAAVSGIPTLIGLALLTRMPILARALSILLFLLAMLRRALLLRAPAPMPTRNTNFVTRLMASVPGTRKRTWARKPNPNTPKEIATRDPNFPFAINDEVTITIESVSNNGDGVGKYKLKNSDGGEGDWVVFVPYTIVGEKVSVRIEKNYKRYSQGCIAKIIEKSIHRIEPKCEYFMSCSGCQYQHMDGNHSRELKREQVQTALERIGGVEPAIALDVVTATIGAGGDYGYRTKLTPHLERRGGKMAMGFMGSGGSLVDIKRCEIASDAINSRYAQVRSDQEVKEEDARETLLFRDCAKGVEVSGSRNVTERVSGVDFHFKAGDFFQNNREVLPLLVEHLRRVTSADGMTYLVDSYCGSGLFSLTLADSFERVYGVEIEASAVESARRNAETNGIDNASFLCGSAERIFSGGAVSKLPREKTAVIMDPPRAGADKLFMDQLLLYSPHRIAYVSCDPATQARDAKLLLAGGYTLESVQPFDLFPNTKHIECVATFVKCK